MNLSLHLGDIALWSVVATIVLTLTMALSQAWGWTRTSFPYMIGSIVSPRRDTAMVSGIILHFVFGLIFALGYVLLFRSISLSTWWLGMLFGLVHGLFVLVVVMPVFPVVHPRMAGKHHGPTPTPQLEPPGYFALNYGRRTPYVTLFAHVLYGGILGLFAQFAGASAA
ncbi:MAG: hypothetical protein ACOCTG_06760 [Bacteroidota bacterium]